MRITALFTIKNDSDSNKTDSSHESGKNFIIVGMACFDYNNL
jgi:hypothetical protein